MQIKATDRDSGLNARLSYAITSGNNGNAFAIKPDGNLTIERNLDRESVEKYQLKINAIDSKYPPLITVKYPPLITVIVLFIVLFSIGF